MKVIIPRMPNFATVIFAMVIFGCTHSPPPNLFPEWDSFKKESTRLEVKQFRENAYMVFHHLGAKTVNSLLVEMKNGELILVDCPVGEKATQSLLSWIEYRLGHRKITAIVTSSRWDRSSGISALIEQKIPVYGSSKTARFLRENSNSSVAQAFSINDVRSVPPNHLFELKNGKSLQLGSERVEIIYPGEGYSVDNVVVHFPESELVFAGGLLDTSKPKKKKWEGALRKIEKLGAVWLVPAEGRKVSFQLVQDSGADTPQVANQ